MGSILLISPMMRGLKKLYPEAKIHLITFQPNYEFCIRINAIDQIISQRNNSLFVFLSDTLKNLKLIWKIKPDIVVDCEFFSNFTSLFSLLTFSKIRVGFHLPQIDRGKLLTHKVPLNSGHHISNTFYSLILGLESKTPEIDLRQLSLEKPSSEKKTSVLQKLNLPGKSQLIVMNPNASQLSFLRRWPKEHFVSLTSMLAEKNKEFIFVFVGSPNEKVFTQSIVDEIALGNVVNSAGLLDIHEFCALLDMSKYIFTNDSLALHISSAYKKNVIAFFGPETPSLYGPLHENSLVFFDNIPCGPCLNVFNNKIENYCQDNICLKDIEPDRVFKEFEKFIKYY